ncbi:hypothetical protein OROMI_006194 [Orobanche minor]
MVLPLLKLGTLSLRNLSKPIVVRIKKEVERDQKFRSLIINFAQHTVLVGSFLGGSFLANYEDSPAGKFDKLVVIAGTVWNPPTSYAIDTRLKLFAVHTD